MTEAYLKDKKRVIPCAAYLVSGRLGCMHIGFLYACTFVFLHACMHAYIYARKRTGEDKREATYYPPDACGKRRVRGKAQLPLYVTSH